MRILRGVILARNGPLLKQSRLRWVVALSALPLLSVVAAFGIVQQTKTDNIQTHAVTQYLPLPETINISERNATFWHEEHIQRGDTITSLLARLKINDKQAIQYLLSSKDVRLLYHLTPDNRVQTLITEGGKLMALRYALGNGKRLIVKRDGDRFYAKQVLLKPKRRIVMKSAEIHSSLFAATDSIGLPDAVAMQITNIFSGEIDFHRDLRRGDRFTVVYEEFLSEGGTVKIGMVLASEFINKRNRYQAIFFRNASGRAGYYTPQGQNLRKTFLRSPLKFSRISSHFAKRRLHPILKIWRSHRGIDYAATTGTKVRATADGTVIFSGEKGGYGKVVMLRHKNGYKTVYGHFSAFARGLRVGQKVKQGKTIGYVGMSGLATGPHLHYEFLVNGVQTNPLKITSPKGPPITAKLRTVFNNSATPLIRRMEMMRKIKLARFD